MTNFAAAFTNELVKISRRKKYVVILILQLAACLAVCLAALPGSPVSLFGTRFELPNITYNLLSPFVTFIMPFVVIMMNADVFSAEMESTDIRFSFLRPVSRFTLFTAKNLAICAAALGYLLANCLALVLFRFILGGSGSVLPEFMAYAVSLVPLASLSFLCSFVAQLFNNPSLSMFVSVLLYIVVSALSMFYAEIGAVLFTSFLRWYRLWLDFGQSAGRIGISAGLILSSGAILFVLGFLIFDAKEG